MPGLECVSQCHNVHEDDVPIWTNSAVPMVLSSSVGCSEHDSKERCIPSDANQLNMPRFESPMRIIGTQLQRYTAGRGTMHGIDRDFLVGFDILGERSFATRSPELLAVVGFEPCRRHSRSWSVKRYNG